MDISSDGRWLFALDSSLSTTPQVRVYSIGSGGVLTAQTTYSITTKTGYAIVPQSLRVSADNAYVAVALGSGGENVLKFDTSAGTFSTVTWINTQSAADGDNAIAWDGNDNLYIARTTSSTSTTYSVLVYSTSSAALTTAVPSSYITGSGPTSMTFANNYAFLYVGNKTDSTISSFSQSGGKLTSISTTNTAAPTTVSALTTDNTGKYVIAAGYDAASGVQVYSTGTTGALAVQPTTGATGTSTTVPALLATTH